jgi:hypothetical protein
MATPGTGGCQCVSTPEMADCLAMAFLTVASGMLYFIRRRALAES